MVMTKEEVKELRKYEAYQKLLNLNYQESLISKRMNEIFLKRMKQPRNRHWHYDDLYYENRKLYEASKKLRMKFNKIRMQFNIPCIRKGNGSSILIPIWNHS